MPVQKSTRVRNAEAEQLEAICGASARFRLYTGTMPANCAAARTGTLVAELTLPSDWMTAGSSGVTNKNGTWSGAAGASGIVSYFSIMDNAGTTCDMQGTVKTPTTINTSASTAANSNVLTFASTTGVVAGDLVTGTNIPDNTTVVSTTSTTVTMSRTVTGTVASGASIKFGGDVDIDNTSVNSGQTVTIGTFTNTAGNA